MLLCFIDFHNLWFLRQMSLVAFFAYFKVKGLALGSGHVESGRLVPVPIHRTTGSLTLTLTCAPALLRWCSFVPPHIPTKYGYW
jgi:hypothetical protein